MYHDETAKGLPHADIFEGWFLNIWETVNVHDLSKH